jgi:MFS family permease
MFFFAQYLNYQQIASIMGIGALVSLVAEIPTGVFADIVGRKWAVVLSNVLYTLAMVGTAFAQNYWMFLVVTIMNALVNALYSGSMEALIYDSLKQEKKEREFDHWISRTETMAWVALFVSTVGGGYLYTLHPTLPYWVQAMATTLGLILSLGLVEPRLDSTKYHLSELLSQNLAGLRELFGKPTLRRWTGILVLIGLGYYIAADLLGLSQLREYGLGTQVSGWVFGLGFIISALAAHFYPRLRKRVGEHGLVFVAGGVMLTSLLLAKWVGAACGIALIMLRISSSTTFRNSRSVIVNTAIASKHRATTLSTLNLLTMLPYALSAGFIGVYIDRTSPNQFAWVLGIGLVGALGMVWVARRIYASQRSLT